MEKPDVDAIEGLSPAISIEQKTAGHNPRSTVGTVTEIYDYLRLLWARVGMPHCPNDGSPVARQSAAQITDSVLAWPEGTRIEVLAPLVRGRKGEFRDLFDDVREAGLRAGPGGRRDLRPGAVPDAQPPPEPRHRRRGGPAGGAGRRTAARLTDSIETALKIADGVVEVVRHGRSAGRSASRSLFSERFACPVCGFSLPELEPRQFSFNSPFGACPDCHGLGTRREVNADLVLGDPSISILEGVILPWGEPSGYLRKVVLPTLAKAFKFDLNAPWGEHSAAAQQALLHGAPGRSSSRPTARAAAASTRASGRACSRTSSGATGSRPATRCGTELEEFMIEQPCQTCGGKRLKPESLAVLVHGHEHRRRGGPAGRAGPRVLREHPAARAAGRAGNGRRRLDAEIAGPILKEVRDRLRFLRDVGLDYLTLGRGATSLSGGEAQRIRLATQIGSRLVGVLYILDEPTIGLHQRDNERLLAHAPRPARSGQHRDRGRARRRHHPRPPTT